MSELEQAQRVLAEYAEKNSLGDFALDEGGMLALHTEDFVYVIQYNDVLNTLVLMACIGAVPPEARGGVFGQLLSANLFWGETAGCTFAFEPSEEQVVMQYSLEVATLDAEQFGRAFDGLRTVAAEWRERMREWIRAELEGTSLEEYMDSL